MIVSQRNPAKMVFAGLALLCTGANSQVPGCSDSFPGTSLGTGWTFLDSDSSADGSQAIVNGQLELSGRGRDIYRQVNQFVSVYRSDVKGDFDLSVKITSQSNTNVWAQAGIYVANNAQNLEEGGYFVLDISPGNGVNVFYDAKDSVGQLETRVGSVGKTVYPMWLRVKKTSKKFSAWYKDSANVGWKVVAENISPQLTLQDSHVALFALSHNITTAGKTTFDDFSCLQEGSTGLHIYRHPAHGNGFTGNPGFVDARGRTMRGNAFKIPGLFWNAE